MSVAVLDSRDCEQLASLPCWRGPITIEGLPGGLTNRNYRVQDRQGSFVARLGADLPLLGIDRRNELACHRAAAACGVAPEVVYHECGVLVSRHIVGRTLAPEDVRDPAIMARLTDLLGRLHTLKDENLVEILPFSVFETVQIYAATAHRLNAPLPGDLDGILGDARRLAGHFKPSRPALCHNDLLAANVLDDGQRLWLVDWEYAGIGNPLFDLAGLSANAAYPDDLEQNLLAHSFGSASTETIRELRILKAMSLLREALWAAIQSVASDLEFDYLGYLEHNLRAFREAWRMLDG